LAVTITYNGFATAPTNVGSYAVVATINNPNYQGSANGTLIISAIAFVAGPVAAPNPAGLITYGVGQTICFSVTGSGGTGTLSYAWTFGDSIGTATGANPTYAYSAAGTYTVTVTATDALGNSASATVTVTVAAPVVGTGTDCTGDGYSDSFLTATGFVPSQPATTSAVQTLAVSSASIKLDFANPGNDSISLSGKLQIPAGLTVKGQVVAVDIGGVIKSFTLGANGVSTPKGNSTFTVKVKSTKGVVKAQTANYAVKLTKGSFATTLAADGLVKANTSKPITAAKTIQVTLLFNGAVLQNNNFTVSYKATSKNGTASAAK
jgi:PKD repeat protein